MTMDEFIDLCIMCGCDYTPSIAGIGPVKAFKFMKDNEGTIENILKAVEENNNDEKKKKKYIVPKPFLYKESRLLFKEPDVISDKESLQGLLKWNKPEEDKLKEFLCGSKGFTEVKVENGIKRLQSS